MIYCGIDPGASGAIAFLSDDPLTIKSAGMTGKVVVLDLPFRSRKPLYVLNKDELLRWVDDAGLASENICLETPTLQAKGKLALAAQFSVVGQLIGILEPGLMVHPTTWKSHYKRLSNLRGKTSKQFSLDLARKVFDHVAQDRLARQMDHNRAEALLIAEYFRQTS